MDLFRQAEKSLRDALLRDFGRSAFGRVLAAGPEVGAMIRNLRALGRLPRTDPYRQACDEIERYAAQGLSDWVKAYLKSLGPAGRLLGRLAGLGPRSQASSLEAAIALLESFGFEVLAPKEAEEALGRARARRSEAAARSYLERHGRPVPTAAEAEEDLQKRRQAAGPGGGMVWVQTRGGLRQFPADHPVVTGDMVPVQSTNVDSVGYDAATGTLYVRFLYRYRRGEREAAAPGSLYGYRDVWPEEFLTLLEAGSKGGWVWDHLRVRGTVSGHKKDYFLAGITGGYVPRKATLAFVRGPKTGRMYPAEVFEPRTVLSGGRWITSRLPPETVQVFRVVKPIGPSMRHLAGLR